MIDVLITVGLNVVPILSCIYFWALNVRNEREIAQLKYKLSVDAEKIYRLKNGFLPINLDVIKNEMGGVIN